MSDHMASPPPTHGSVAANDALKAAIRQYALDQGADLVGFVSAAHLNAVTPTRYTPKRLWPEARTAISIGKRILRGAISVGTGDSVQNARWVAWRTNEFLNRRAMDVGHFIERRGPRALPLSNGTMVDPDLSLIHISEPTRLVHSSRMPSSA